MPDYHTGDFHKARSPKPLRLPRGEVSATAGEQQPAGPDHLAGRALVRVLASWKAASQEAPRPRISIDPNRFTPTSKGLRAPLEYRARPRVRRPPHLHRASASASKTDSGFIARARRGSAASARPRPGLAADSSRALAWSPAFSPEAGDGTRTGGQAWTVGGIQTNADYHTRRDRGALARSPFPAGPECPFPRRPCRVGPKHGIEG
jgi:hypothetical protein